MADTLATRLSFRCSIKTFPVTSLWSISIPLERPGIPKEPRDILNRINEISFNSSLLRELRAINFVQRLIAEGSVDEGAMKRVLVHMIADDTLMTELSVASKTIPVPGIIFELRDAGHAAADDFLTQHRDKIGVASSVDLAEMYD